MAKEGSHDVVSDFIDFLNASPTAFHAVDEAKKRLQTAGYEQLSEKEVWELKAGHKYFFTRNYSTVVAFAVGKRYVAGNGFHIIGAHTDSPALKLKPVTKVVKGGILEVGVQTYGGGLWHTWFDRDLTVAGRVILRQENSGSVSYSHRLVRIDEPIMRIPTLAIHLDRGVNDGFKVNTQTHLLPILATALKAEVNKVSSENDSVESGKQSSGKKENNKTGSSSTKHHPILLQLLANKLGCEPDDFCDFELQACDTQPSIVAGAAKEFVFSGRLDNLCMSFCSLKALIDATSSDSSLEEETGVRMVALFDHEECGSNSAQGAGSPVMVDALSRVTNSFDANSRYNSLKDINKKSWVTCDFCGHESHGGITRAREHQLHIKGNVRPCLSIPKEIKMAMQATYDAKLAEAAAALKDQLNEDEDEQNHVDEIHDIRVGKQIDVNVDDHSSKKAKTVKGPLDLHFNRAPPTTTKLGKEKKQASICDKLARDRACEYICDYFYKCSIPFNTLRDKSFKLMIEAAGNYGPNLKIPTYHEMRNPFLRKALNRTKEELLPNIEERAITGCSIMSDAWTDRKNRTLINFMVNTTRGTMFEKSVDASAYMKTGQAIFELLDHFVTEVGEQNVVQVVTDNGSNYVLAGKKLMERRQNLFWTPCAAHCVDLMLEDIGSIPKVKRVCQRGVKVVGFIYNHTMALNVMRKFTNKVELIRAGITRFATHFLTLQRLHQQKTNLRKMFTSDEWEALSVSKDPKGKSVRDIVLMQTFWKDVLYTLKVMGPLVQVLRLVDNEKKPAMGYIYEAMDRAKEAMIKSFNGNEEKYKDVFAIIDKRWDCQLHHPLHAAGHYFNPQYFYSDPNVDKNEEVIVGLMKTIEKLCLDEEEEDKATTELAKYRRKEGLFGMKAAIRNRNTMAPAEWWRTYGINAPSLQRIAIKVLSLTCSSSGCERNWSTFEQIHSKKRNKLEHQKLQDLVYIKYNQKLKERFNSRDLTDPIVLKEIDLSNEWLIGEMDEDEVDAQDLVFEGDSSLNWDHVANAAGINEPIYATRQQQRISRTNQAVPTTQNMEDEEEEDGEHINEDDDDDIMLGDDYQEEELGDSD